MHHPVLLQKVIDCLDIKSKGLYIDATLGEGGYTREILKKGAKVLAIDWDLDELEKQKAELKNRNAIFYSGNFADIDKIATSHHFYPVDGVVFDLGLSMGQLKSGRGFSFRAPDDPLDMRISSELVTEASDIVNSLNGTELYEIFAKYSEEINSRAISDAIVGARQVKKILKVGDLLAVIRSVLKKDENKVYSRIFQALRIAVNHEFDNLKQGVTGAAKIISKDGHIVVVTFHSLEDRIVKRWVRESGLRFNPKKPIVSDGKAPYERSAKLRFISL